MSPLFPSAIQTNTGYTPVFTNVLLSPSSVSLTSGSPTATVTPSYTDQNNIAFAPPSGTTGGLAAFTSTTTWMATGASIGPVAAIANQMAIKCHVSAGWFSGTAVGHTGAMWSIDGNGLANGNNLKIGLYVAPNGGGTASTISLKGTGFSSMFAPTLTYSQLPSAGTMMVVYSLYDSVNGVRRNTVYDQYGNLYATGNATGATAALSAVSNGFAILNSASSGGYLPAGTFGGLAIYSAPLAAAQEFTIPTATDANLVALWQMGDATSGTAQTSAAAQVGGQPLVKSAGTLTWSTGNTWSGTPGTPINYATSNPLIATVSTGGVITRVAVGTCTVYAWIGNVVGAVTVTCT